jgi:hypothetical protein
MTNSGIKKVYLHIGLNKTATTSIQESLGQSVTVLKDEGYLYPLFNDILNQSMCHCYHFTNYCKAHPEKAVQNLQHGSKAADFAQTNKIKFVNSLSNQLADFSCNKMIISAEDLITLNVEEIINLKSLLNCFTANDCEVEVIIFVRHPVTYAQSSIQQGVKTGYNTIQSRTIGLVNLLKDFQSKVIKNYSECFGISSIKVVRFEDAIQHPFGPLGKFLTIIGFPEEKFGLFPQLNINESISFEAAIILSAINGHFPKVINKQWNSERKVLLLSKIILLPGQKFSLPFANQLQIWNASQNDMDWLIENFDLEPYEFSPDKISTTNNLWSIETLKQLEIIVPDLPAELKSIVVQVLEREISNSFGSISDDSKKLMQNQIKSIYNSLPKLNDKTMRRLVLIHHANFKKHFEIELSNPSICMISEGMFEIRPVNMPFVLNLPKVMKSFESKTFIILNIHSSKKSRLTLEYQTPRKIDFDTSFSLGKSVNEGINNIGFEIADFDFNGNTRLVFNDSEVSYQIQSIEIKTDALSYEDMFKENERMKKQIESLEKTRASFFSPVKTGLSLLYLKVRNLLNTLKSHLF